MTCFLCLQNVCSFIIGDNVVDEEGSGESCEKVSLVSIHNYLNLKLSENDFETNCEDEDVKGLLEVSMCQECESVTSRLSLLCNQFEKLKLKINYSLQNFYERMKEVGKVEEGTRVEEKLVLLRKKYKEKCKSKLNCLRQPLIKIVKLNQVPQRTPKQELMLSEEESGDVYDTFLMSEEGSGLEENHLQNTITVLVKHNEEVKKEEDNWEYSSSSISSLAIPPSPKLSSYNNPSRKRRYSSGSAQKNVFPCRTCGLEFPSAWERRQHTHVHRNPRKLDRKEANFICTNCESHPMFKESRGFRYHNMIFHVELLFPSSKMEGITSTQYAEYCKHVLHVEGLISKLPNSVGYACQHCKPRRVTFNSYLSLKKHLFRDHMDILGGKIERLQMTTGVEELKQAVLPPVSDNQKCDKCGAAFSQTYSLSRHLRQSCPFRKNKSVSSARPCKCQDCGLRYSSTAGFYRHRKCQHPNSTRNPIFL